MLKFYQFINMSVSSRRKSQMGQELSFNGRMNFSIGYSIFIGIKSHIGREE